MFLRQIGSHNSASSPTAAETSPGRRDLNRILNGLAILGCIGLYLYHFFVVWTYAVDVPFWDEWEMLSPGALSPNLNIPWLFAQHNEHRIVTDKLFIWLLLRWNGWDIAAQQLLNFLIYGALLLVVVQMARKTAPKMPLWAILSFVVFLLSPINHENHLMAFQSSFHFVVLFFLCAALFFFDTKTDADGNTTQSWKSLLLGSLFAVLSIYSLASGLLSCAVLLLVFGIWKTQRARNAAAALQSREWRQFVAVGLLLAGAMALWFVGWQASTSQSLRASPFSALFWVWFLNILSAGFGFASYSVIAGLACLVFVLAPFAKLLLRSRSALRSRQVEEGTNAFSFWAPCAVTLGLLAVLLFVTSGRIGYGLPASKTPRYTEFVLVLIPLAAAAWYPFVAGSRMRVPVLVALWTFCFLSFLPTWGYFRFYPERYTEREAGAACTGKYYQTGNPSGKDWHCRSIAPLDIPLNERLNRARELGVSFSRKLEQP
ncbi:MAG TPA: hypothetical protein VM821_01880 [Abditibacteriaceae bacterium]|nr:hypothetical protein [Abditibacteriaceae bacterium]